MLAILMSQARITSVNQNQAQCETGERVGAETMRKQTLSRQGSERNKYVERSRVSGHLSLTISIFLIRSSFKTPAPCNPNSFH